MGATLVALAVKGEAMEASPGLSMGASPAPSASTWGVHCDDGWGVAHIVGGGDEVPELPHSQPVNSLSTLPPPRITALQADFHLAHPFAQTCGTPCFPPSPSACRPGLPHLVHPLGHLLHGRGDGPPRRAHALQHLLALALPAELGLKDEEGTVCGAFAW